MEDKTYLISGIVRIEKDDTYILSRVYIINIPYFIF